MLTLVIAAISNAFQFQQPLYHSHAAQQVVPVLFSEEQSRRPRSCLYIVYSNKPMVDTDTDGNNDEEVDNEADNYTNNKDNDDDDDDGRYLCVAGEYIKEASTFSGDGPHLLLYEAGQSIVDIGNYWSSSWEAVCYAAEDASSSFHTLSRLQSQSKLATLYSASCGELKALSNIVGCTSVGPPSALPNLEGFAKNLIETAKYVEEEEIENDEDNDEQDSKAFGKALRKASKSIQSLVQDY